jgi:tRNA 2-thiocytidine biosynthesis protein TtcA
MKKGIIYSCARREGYNVIAMGQHLDDMAEDFINTAFNNGKLRAMKANYTLERGDLRIIRPLVYCREKLFKEFSKEWNLPIIPKKCPPSCLRTKEKRRIKNLLTKQESEIPTLFYSLLNCMRPLMTVDVKDILRDK